MRSQRHIVIPTCLAMLASANAASASVQSGLHFAHGDWEIACDNTRTCRAAGYHSEGGSDDAEPRRVSVLLTRKAGPGAPVEGELQIGNPGEGETTDELPRTLALTMKINGQPFGKVVINQGKWTVGLTPAQTQALLAALTRNSRIEWTDGRYAWRLSDKGGAAVLLKMDEFQGRLGTPGALVRKGSQDENSVLPPLPAPVVVGAAVPANGYLTLPKAATKALRGQLRATMKDCNEPDEEASGRQDRDDLRLYRLSAAKLLASMTCWTGAYNEGAAFWVINAKPPYSPELVTTDGSDYSAGKIVRSHKGRGIGDCWAFEDWTWDGKRFVHTGQSTTGDCRWIAPGGTWSLPVLVTTVRRPGSKS